MISNKTLYALSVILIDSFSFSQSTDTITRYQFNSPVKQTTYFRSFSGGINAIYNNKKSKGGVDMAVQTYHYYMVTGKRAKTDSLHQLNLKKKSSLTELYKGFHFFILNRVAIDFDSVQTMAVDYFTSLKSSPLTLRVKKELFLTKQHQLSPFNYIPVISILLTGDGRTLPYVTEKSHIKAGISGHFYLTFSALFKRLEFDINGNQVDQGVIYFRPSIGLGYGTNDLMKSLLPRKKKEPILSTEFTLGFKSEKNSIKDFSLLFGYTVNKIAGPRIRAGVILSSL